MSFNPNMSNKDVADLIFLDYKSKKPWLNLDFANVTTTGLEATRDFATGGQARPTGWPLTATGPARWKFRPRLRP